MSQQEYQRRFAMLRPHQQMHSAMAGFARFEVHGGRGRVTVSVQGITQDAPLHVVLIGGMETEPVLCDCGALLRTKSGQGGLCYEFDPTNLSGLPFDRYHTCIAVLRMDSDAQILLSGVFGKCTQNADWSARSRRLKVLWYAQESMPETTESVSSAQENVERSQTPDADETDPFVQQLNPPAAESVQNAALVRPAQEPEITAVLATAARQSEKTEESMPSDPHSEMTAEQTHAALQSAKWSGHAYGLKPMFEKYPPQQVFDTRSDVLFVRVPMTLEFEPDHYLLGAHVSGGQIDAVCVAIPGTYAPQAPAGLMGAVFAKTQGQRGYWFSWQDGYTGRPLDLPWPWQDAQEDCVRADA